MEGDDIMKGKYYNKDGESFDTLFDLQSYEHQKKFNKGDRYFTRDEMEFDNVKDAMKHMRDLTRK